jgi:hypothetical protein
LRKVERFFAKKNYLLKTQPEPLLTF